MTSLKLIGAVAIAASAFATPSFAQSVISNPGACESMFASANCENSGAGSPYMTSRQDRQQRMAHRAQNRANDGAWPLGTAGAVAGAAVGTAAAVATAPFQGWGNSYASYDRGGPAWYGNWDAYAARNGIVCRPGTYFKGEDGRQHLCQ